MNTDHIISDIFRATRRETLQYAFWRIESAVVIAIAIVMTGLSLLNIFFLPAMWWMWLLFGIIGEAALIYTGMQDKKLMAKLASKLFYERLSPNQMQTPQLKQAMIAALDFHRSVFGMVSGGQVTTIGEIAIDMDQWVVHVFRIIGHLDQVITTPTVLPPLPETTIKSHLNRHSTVEAYATAVSDISKEVTTLSSKEAAKLQYVHNTVTQAKTHIDSTLSQVHQIYTQLGQGMHRGQERNFVTHIRQTMTEQFVLLERSNRTLEVLLPLQATPNS